MLTGTDVLAPPMEDTETQTIWELDPSFFEEFTQDLAAAGHVDGANTGAQVGHRVRVGPGVGPDDRGGGVRSCN